MAELLVAAHQRRAASFANSGAHFDFGRFLVKPAPHSGLDDDEARTNAALIAARMSWVLGQGVRSSFRSAIECGRASV